MQNRIHPSYRRHIYKEPFRLFPLLPLWSWKIKTIIAYARILAALRYDLVVTQSVCSTT